MRNSPTPSAPEFAQVRHVDEQASVHVQLDARLVLGDGGHVLERAVLALSAGEEADLVGIGGDHVGGGTQVNLAREGVDDRRVAGIDALDDTARLPHGRDAQRLGNDGHVALCAAILDDEAAQPLAVVVEKLGRPHGAGNEDRIGRKLRRLVCAGDAAGEDAQEPVGQVAEVALALAPIGVVLAQHARARAVLHALDRGFRREPALDGLAQPPHPALVVGKHAVGLEHLAVLSGAGQVLVIEHLVQRSAQRGNGRVQPAELDRRVLGQELRHDDARLVQHDVAQRDAGRDRLALDDRGQRLADLDRGAGARDRARDEMLGDDHRGRLQHLDVLVGVFLLRAVLHHEHAQHLARALDRHREQRVIDLLARFRPIGEGRVARGLGLVHRDVELGAAAYEALAALHARGVHRA